MCIRDRETKVGKLLERQKEVFLKRRRQRRVASFINQTEVIELMVYVDKLLYDRYQQNRTHIERHILAILNLVCACMYTCWCVLLSDSTYVHTYVNWCVHERNVRMSKSG